jgi:glyoxylase-like metal-dependent hydrolase (beta-lactamase superfamily II)
MKLYLFNCGTFETPARAMFGSMPEEERVSLYPDYHKKCTWTLRSLLIDDGKHLLLVDTGFNLQYEKQVIIDYAVKDYKSPIQALAELGYECDGVSDLLHTHLHLDHCGGTYKVGIEQTLQPAFINTRCMVSKQQLNTALKPSEFEANSFPSEIVKAISCSENLVIFDNHKFLYPWIELRMFYGHTNGLIVPLIHIQNQTLVFVGDLIPSAAHISANAIAEYDVNPELTYKEKLMFLDEAFEKHFILIFQHDFYHECCTLKKENSRVVPTEFFKLKDFI